MVEPAAMPVPETAVGSAVGEMPEPVCPRGACVIDADTSTTGKDTGAGSVGGGRGVQVGGGETALIKGGLRDVAEGGGVGDSGDAVRPVLRGAEVNEHAAADGDVEVRGAESVDAITLWWRRLRLELSQPAAPLSPEEIKAVWPWAAASSQRMFQKAEPLAPLLASQPP